MTAAVDPCDLAATLARAAAFAGVPAAADALAGWFQLGHQALDFLRTGHDALAGGPSAGDGLGG